MKITAYKTSTGTLVATLAEFKQRELIAILKPNRDGTDEFLAEALLSNADQVVRILSLKERKSRAKPGRPVGSRNRPKAPPAPPAPELALAPAPVAA